MSSSGVRSSLPVNSNVALVAGVKLGGVAVSSVSGARPTVHSCTAGVGSTPRSGRFARTSRRCEPSVSPPTKCGEPQLCHSEPSSAHSKVTPAVLEEKVKVALESAVGEAGAESSVVFGGGGGATIVQVWTAGVWSTLPARSVARTRSVCWASDRPVSSCGDSQSAYGPLSSEHSKRSTASSALSEKVAVVSIVGEAGPDRISGTGAGGSGGGSTVPTQRSGVESKLPAASRARTSMLWSPSVRPLTRCGDSQAAKVAPSSEHWKVAPASSLDNSKVALVSWVGSSGPESIDVSGGVTSSTVQAWVAGDPSTLPAWSIARTRIV